jgi:hypothetical protein
MKRIIAITAFLFAFAFAAQADERQINIGHMPRVALDFLKTYFADSLVTSANIERDVLDTDYEVKLVDGTEIDFDGRGEWTEITNRRSGVAATMLPLKITEYVKANYPDAHYIKIERGSRKYEVKLTNGLELLFSLNGEMIGFDD